MTQANVAFPANSLEQYVYAIQEVYNNTSMPTTLVQNETSGGSGGGFLSSVTGAVGVHERLPGHPSGQITIRRLSSPVNMHDC
jgi:hypothetical protein